eukprot:gene41096-50859_t
MKLANLKIGARLGLGFGVVLLLMAALIGVGLQRLWQIGDLSATMVDKDWRKADAAATIATTTRANSALVLELFIVTDKTVEARIHADIDTNKKTISGALELLDQLVYLPQGKAMLAAIRTHRAQYVQSFGKVSKLIAAGQRDEAAQLMSSETLPVLAALQGSVKQLNDLQRGIVAEHGAQVKENIGTAERVMAGVGVVALLLGVAFAWRVTHSITTPIGRALRVARAVAAGDLTSHIKEQSAQLAQSVSVFKLSESQAGGAAGAALPGRQARRKVAGRELALHHQAVLLCRPANGRARI